MTAAHNRRRAVEDRTPCQANAAHSYSNGRCVWCGTTPPPPLAGILEMAETMFAEPADCCPAWPTCDHPTAAARLTRS